MSLRIGFLTSLGVNVGDEFIREGIRSVLDRIGEPYEPFYVHKLDKNTLRSAAEDERRLVEDKFWDCDCFIQAGAPVYWHLFGGKSNSLNSEWHEWMWQERILKEGKSRPDFINLGAGSCQPWGEGGDAFLRDPACADFAREAARLSVLTTVRDPVADDIMTQLDLPHKALPCPAFLAGRRHLPQRPVGRHVAVNLMPIGAHYDLASNFNRDAWFKDCCQLVHRLRKRHPLIFVAHDAEERAFMNLLVEGDERVLFSKNWRDYFDFYSSIRGVIANRVHGAVCAAGFNVPSMILGNDTRARIGEYIGIPALRSGAATPAEIEEVFESLERRQTEESQRLEDLSARTLANYENLLAPLLQAAHRKVKSGSGVAKVKIHPRFRLASVEELESPAFREWMAGINSFAEHHQLRTFTNWSKIWEYPWLWHAGLKRIDWSGSRLLDLGSEICPFPWLASIKGAKVNMVEVTSEWEGRWRELKAKLGTDITWDLVQSERLPFADATFDVVTSFSVVEHQPDKKLAVDEIVRVLKPGGLLAISFDICEPDLGMTFPEWNGRALRLQEWESLFWNHPGFENGPLVPWNREAIEPFLAWHRQSAPHHNYVTGAAVLVKKLGDRSDGS